MAGNTPSSHNSDILDLSDYLVSDNLKKISKKILSALELALPINGLDLEDLDTIDDEIDAYGNLLIKVRYTKYKAYKNRIMVVLNGQDDFFKDPDGDIMFHGFNAITSSIIDIDKSITKKKENPNSPEQYESELVRRFSGLYNTEQKDVVKDENGNNISIFFDYSPKNDKSQMKYRIDKNDRYRKLVDKIEDGVVIPWKDENGNTDFYEHIITDGYHFIKDENPSDGVKIIFPGETQYYNNGQQLISPKLEGGYVYFWNTKEAHKQRLGDTWSNMSTIEQNIFIKESTSIIVPGLDKPLPLTDIIIKGDLNITGNSNEYIIYNKEGQWNFHNIVTRKSDLVLSDKEDYSKNHKITHKLYINERTAFCIKNVNTNTYKLLYYSPQNKNYIFTNKPRETPRSVEIERYVSRFEGNDDLVRRITVYELTFLLDNYTKIIIEKL